MLRSWRAPWLASLVLLACLQSSVADVMVADGDTTSQTDPSTSLSGKSRALSRWGGDHPGRDSDKGDRPRPIGHEHVPCAKGKPPRPLKTRPPRPPPKTRPPRPPRQGHPQPAAIPNHSPTASGSPSNSLSPILTPSPSLSPAPSPSPSPSPHKHEQYEWLDALWGTADSLGLTFLKLFFKESYPAFQKVLDDLPVAANYIYKLFKKGLTENLTDPNGPAASALHEIVTRSFSFVYTDTGSFIVNRLAIEHHLDLGAVAVSGSFSQMLDVFKGAKFSRNGADSGADGAADIVKTVSVLTESIALEAIHPYGRLAPLGVATDIVDFAYQVATGTLQQYSTLQSEASKDLVMTAEEVQAFTNLQENLGTLRGTLNGLYWQLEIRNDDDNPRGSPPLSSPAPSPSSSPTLSPGPGPGPGSWPSSSPGPGSGPASSPSWHSPSPSPSPSPSSSFRFLDALWSAMNKLGLHFLVAFFEDAYEPLAAVLETAPTFADYIYQLIGHVIKYGGVDGSEEIAPALYNILHATFAKLASTDIGSVIGNQLSWYDIRLYELATASSIEDIISIFRKGRFWNAYWDWSQGAYDGYQVFSSVIYALQQVVYEAVGPYGRLTPIKVAYEVVDIAQTVVSAVTNERDWLYWGLNDELTMTDQQEASFDKLAYNLQKLQTVLGTLEGDIGDIMSQHSSQSPPPPWWYPSIPSQGGQPPSTPLPDGQPNAPFWMYPSPRPWGPSGGSSFDNSKVLAVLKDTMESLGLNFLLNFFSDAYAPVRGIVEEVPTAADYVYKVIAHGPRGKANLKNTLHNILHSFVDALLKTDTGSIIAQAATSYNLQLGDLLDSPDLEAALEVFKRATFWPAPGGWVQGVHDGYSVLSSVLDVVREVLLEALGPYGRLTPIKLAHELVHIAERFVHSVSENALALRNALDDELFMTDAEYYSFTRLDALLSELSFAFKVLDENVEDLQQHGGSHSPAPGPHPGYSPSLSPRPSWGPSPSPPAGSKHNEVFRALRKVATTLGVDFVLDFVNNSYEAIRNLAVDSPIATNYIYKLISAGLTPELADQQGAAAQSLNSILQPTFYKLSETDVGSIFISHALAEYRIDLGKLASAPDLPSTLKALTAARWGTSDPHFPGNQPQGPVEVVATVLNTLNTIFDETYARYGRLEPIGLASDLVDVSLALVNSTVAEADTLRWVADANFRMDDEEYQAFWNIRINLSTLRYALFDLKRNLGHG